MTEQKTGKWKYILLKALFVQIAFLLLHYSYDWFPNTITRILSGTNESVFQHMKIAFYSYGLVSLVEFLIFRKVLKDPLNFGITRMASTVFYCWPMFILFFTPPAIFGKYPNDIYEIVSANIILYTISIIAGIFELELSRIKLSKEFRVVAIGLTLVFITILTIYSFKDPWFDVFAIPPGWE